MWNLIFQAEFKIAHNNGEANDYAEVRTILNEYFKVVARKHGVYSDYVSLFIHLNVNAVILTAQKMILLSSSCPCKWRRPFAVECTLFESHEIGRTHHQRMFLNTVILRMFLDISKISRLHRRERHFCLLRDLQ